MKNIKIKRNQKKTNTKNRKNGLTQKIFVYHAGRFEIERKENSVFSFLAKAIVNSEFSSVAIDVVILLLLLLLLIIIIFCFQLFLQ